MGFNYCFKKLSSCSFASKLLQRRPGTMLFFPAIYLDMGYLCLTPSSIIRRAVATHYDTLGLTKEAKREDIKQAYIKLTKQHHPDTKNSDDFDEFLKISEAYEILINSSTRRQYDFQQFGKSSDFNRFKTGEYELPKKTDFERHHSKQKSEQSNSVESEPVLDETIKNAFAKDIRWIYEYLMGILISICIAMYLLSRYQRQKPQEKDEN